MNICDKCIEPTKASISIEVDHQSFDLCQLHHQELMIFLTTKEDEKEIACEPQKKKRGPKPKNSGDKPLM